MTLFSHDDYGDPDKSFAKRGPDPSLKTLESLLGARIIDEVGPIPAEDKNIFVGTRMIEPIPAVAKPVKIKTFSLEEIKARLTPATKVLSVEIDDDLSEVIVFINGREFIEVGK
jgi:hypothetical protein